jgi:VWFA-related protein
VRARHVALLAASALVARGGSAQAPPARPPVVIEAGVELVSLTAVMHDKAGHFVSGLTQKDVEVLENGVRQDLLYFREAGGEGADKIPLSVILTLDASGSMRDNLGFLQEAAISFVRKLEGADMALVVQFNESIKGSAEFTGDTERLEQFVEALQAWGGTSLYDSIHYSLNRIRTQPGRKAVIVFSDGADTTSQMKESEVIDYARAVEATVYTVGIRGTDGLMARSPRGFLRKIADETGGGFFFPERVADLIKVFSAISDELHRHYALAYAPKRAPDGSWRAIELKVARPDVQVRVRKGYFAVKRRR